MKQEITNIQALQALYTASTKANLTKQEHDFLLECAKQLELLVNPPKEETPKDK